MKGKTVVIIIFLVSFIGILLTWTLLQELDFKKDDEKIDVSYEQAD